MDKRENRGKDEYENAKEKNHPQSESQFSLVNMTADNKKSGFEKKKQKTKGIFPLLPLGRVGKFANMPLFVYCRLFLHVEAK